MDVLNLDLLHWLLIGVVVGLVVRSTRLQAEAKRWRLAAKTLQGYAWGAMDDLRGGVDATELETRYRRMRGLGDGRD